jgi:hypothetical protein
MLRADDDLRALDGRGSPDLAPVVQDDDIGAGGRRGQPTE